MNIIDDFPISEACHLLAEMLHLLIIFQSKVNHNSPRSNKLNRSFVDSTTSASKQHSNRSIPRIKVILKFMTFVTSSTRISSLETSKYYSVIMEIFND